MKAGKRLVNRLDPIHWPSRVVLTVFLAILVVPPALDLSGFNIPHWVVVPGAGTVAWRAQGRRYRDIAIWVVPLVAIDLLSFERLPPELFAIVYALVLLAAAAMVFSERLQNVWLSLVAPGHYRAMSDTDRAINNALLDLDIDIWEAQKRLAKTQDLSAFRRKSAAAQEKALALSIDDPDWQRVRTLWLSYLAWWDERDGPPEVEDSWEDLDARRAAYTDALSRIHALRSQPLGH